MFISKIRHLMDEKGKTLRNLSKETGLSTRTILRATQDATFGGCQINTLARIAEALGVETKELYEEKPDKPSAETAARGV